MHDEYLLERGGAARFLWEAKRSRGKIRLTGDLIPFASLPTPSLDGRMGELGLCITVSLVTTTTTTAIIPKFEYTIREEGLFVLHENETKTKNKT